MKKTEYAGSHVPDAGEKQQMLDSSKQDDYTLPEFAKEVPVSSKKREKEDIVSVEYKWNKSTTPIIRIEKIDFRKDEGLKDLYRIETRDGADSVSFKYNNVTYILRKTAKEIARALFNAYGKMRGALESVVGYIRTVMGNDYVIAKAEGETWSFDKRIARGDINYVDVDSLDGSNKRKLCEMITEKIAELHSNNLIIGRFSLNNVLLGEGNMRFTDLRKLRVSRRRPFVIEEFTNILQYLFAIGIASRDDVYCSIAYYAAQNEDSCTEWYAENKGGKPKDELDIVGAIEDEVYS